MDRRYQPSRLEIREDGDSVVVSGYAAVFFRSDDGGTEFEPFPDVTERIMPQAFDRALSERHDVRALFNHDPSQLLGRTTSGTLQLTKDAKGLRYDITLPDTTIGRDVRQSISRGDLSGSSFAFRVTDEEWRDQKNGPTIREIRDVQLYDVGPVTYPAYTSTTSGLRDDFVHEARQAHSGWVEHQQRQAARLAAEIEHQEVEAILAGIDL